MRRLAATLALAAALAAPARAQDATAPLRGGERSPSATDGSGSPTAGGGVGSGSPAPESPAPPAGPAATGLQATLTESIIVDEDRLWVTAFLDLIPADGRPVTLAAGQRRFAPPSGAGAASRGGLRAGGRDLDEVELVDGAVLLPEQVPAEGLAAALEYSVPAAGDSAACTVRLPFALADLRVTASAQVGGIRLSIAGTAPAPAKREGPAAWTATARRTTPAAPGEPVRVAVSGLPAYHVPLYAKAALLLAAHLAGLSLLNLLRRRRKAAA